MEFRRLKRLLTLGLGAAALGRPAPAAGQEGAWRPRTVPLIGGSYAPDLGLVVGVGVVHTRYAFSALPPGAIPLGEAACCTGRARRPSAPASCVRPAPAPAGSIVSATRPRAPMRQVC